MLSFLMAIIWIWGFANLLVDLLELVGIVANLPLEFLGLTFLGFGNAMPGMNRQASHRYIDGSCVGTYGIVRNGVDGLCI